MPDYIPISDASVDPDAPVTSELMYALRDNPIAMLQGADGAPRMRPGAFNSEASTSATTGHRVFPTFNLSSNQKDFACIGSGSVRVRSPNTVLVPGGSGSVQVLVNGNFIGAAGDGQVLNIVFSFNNGDMITINGGGAILNNIEFRTMTPSLPFLPWIV